MASVDAVLAASVADARAIIAEETGADFEPVDADASADDGDEADDESASVDGLESVSSVAVVPSATVADASASDDSSSDTEEDAGAAEAAASESCELLEKSTSEAIVDDDDAERDEVSMDDAVAEVIEDDAVIEDAADEDEVAEDDEDEDDEDEDDEDEDESDEDESDEDESDEDEDESDEDESDEDESDEDDDDDDDEDDEDDEDEDDDDDEDDEDEDDDDEDEEDEEDDDEDEEDEEDEDDDDEDVVAKRPSKRARRMQPTPVQAYIALHMYDCMLRGKRLVDGELVDVERFETRADRAPYTSALLADTELARDDVVRAYCIFIDEHEARLARWIARSSDFAYLARVLTNALRFKTYALCSVDDAYRRVLVTYDDDATVARCYRESLVDVPVHVSVRAFAAAWAVLNVDTAMRAFVYERLEELVESLPTSYSLLEYLSALSADMTASGRAHELETSYAQWTKVVDAWLDGE